MNMINNSPFSIEKLTGIFRTSPKDPMRIINREGTTIEFKESYNHCGMAQYFKTIVSFANNMGGYIIFGVGDKPRRLLGLQEKSLQQFEELKVEDFTESLLDYFSPEIKWDHCTFEYKEKSFGVIYVFPLEKKPCICKKHYDDKNSKYALKEGDIYYRYGGRSERIRYPELSAIIEESRQLEEKRWLNFFQQTAKIGISNACLLDTKSGELSGKGGTVVLDKKLLKDIAFIHEGEFVEKNGKPALKLIGEIREISTGRVVIKEVPKKVVRAIEPCNVIESFLTKEKVEEPLEFIKSICSATSANYPIYYYIKQSDLPIAEIMKIVENTTARGIAKAKLLERLNGKLITNKAIPISNSVASKYKKIYREQWIQENITEPVKYLNYCLQSIFSLTSEEIIAHGDYLRTELLKIFQSYYETSDSSTASYIRVAICRVDEAIYFTNN